LNLKSGNLWILFVVLWNKASCATAQQQDQAVVERRKHLDAYKPTCPAGDVLALSQIQPIRWWI
jgi:hypothetical protein